MRIPVKAAKDIATQFNLRQVILLAWDGKLTHVVTYGKTVDDCSQAADGANALKKKWGWPECNDQPSRVKKLQSALTELLELLDNPDVELPSSPHTGACGPDAGCDGVCLSLASIGDIVRRARRLL